MPHLAPRIVTLAWLSLAAAGVACGSSSAETREGDTSSTPTSPDDALPPTTIGPDASRIDGTTPDGGARDAAATDAATAEPGRDAAASDAASDAAPSSDDPFDPGSCSGALLTPAGVLARLAGAPRASVSGATLLRRSRTCAGATAATCGPWGAPVPHEQALLTYSGGAVTDTKVFGFPSTLVFFVDGAVAKVSLRHDTDVLHAPDSSKRGIVFEGFADPMARAYPILNVWDVAPKPNRYEDLQALLGDRAELHARERCARFVAFAGVTTEIAAVLRY